MGNIAEALLKEGLAKCVDWSISKVNILEIHINSAQVGQKLKKFCSDENTSRLFDIYI